jgi:hypothetical protein
MAALWKPGITCVSNFTMVLGYQWGAFKSVGQNPGAVGM